MVLVRSIDWTTEGEPYCVHYAELDERGDEYRISLAPDVFELMRFTGLTDKNGQEIYEGDVVRGCFKNNFGSFTCERGVVEWYDGEGSWVVKVPEDEGGSVSWGIIRFKYRHGLELEVLGNVYEHPDLLESR
jgi:uncharacterized phage protein (TIGR01671 family)